MENEAAFVVLRDFGTSAYGMFWSTEEMLTESEIPAGTTFQKIVIPHARFQAGYDVMAHTWNDEIFDKDTDRTVLIVTVAAIEDELLDRIFAL